MLRSNADVHSKSPAEIDALRRCADAVSELLAIAQSHCVAGITTAALDEIVLEEMRRFGAQTLFRGYVQGSSPPFPGNTCISVNDEVVHGIPGDRVIRPGDLVSIDIGIRLGEFCGDSATSVLVPLEADSSTDQHTEHGRVRALVRATRDLLDSSLAEMTPGRWWSEVGGCMESQAREGGFGVVTQYVGHGIGRSLHEPPSVPAFRTSFKGKDFRLEPGLVLAIEPMLTLTPGCPGEPAPALPEERPDEGWRAKVRLGRDRWTVLTIDGSLACHEERMVLIGESGAEVLTRVGEDSGIGSEMTQGG